MLAAFHRNRDRIKGLEHPAPSSIQNAVIAQIREQAANASVEKSPRTLQLPDIGRWLPDFGRWFFRPVTVGATGLLTLALIFGALYFSPTTPQYEETLDFYFGLHTEQLTDNPLNANGGIPPSDTQTDESLESGDDADLFLNLYLENVGN